MLIAWPRVFERSFAVQSKNGSRPLRTAPSPSSPSTTSPPPRPSTSTPSASTSPSKSPTTAAAPASSASTAGPSSSPSTAPWTATAGTRACHSELTTPMPTTASGAPRPPCSARRMMSRGAHEHSTCSTPAATPSSSSGRSLQPPALRTPTAALPTPRARNTSRASSYTAATPRARPGTGCSPPPACGSAPCAPCGCCPL